MRLALDTNVYSDVCRGDEEAEARVARAEALFLPFVVIGELRAGFSLGARARENERILQRFLAKPSVDILFATEATTLHYASLYRQLREQGTPVPTNDLWIAALVVEHRLTLYSHDRHFDHLPQLDRWM
jgi:tRNA(fMet)-specific endonuclease VapC